MSQEVGNGVLGVRCFRSTRKESVPVSVLQRHHRWCTFPNSDSDNCFAAANRWCNSFRYSGGITQEVGNSHMTVACYNAQFSNDVFVRRISDFYAAQRRVSTVCNVNFDISRGTLHSRPELLSSQLYNNIDSSVPLTSTFDVSKTITKTNSFTHGHQFTFGVDTQVSVQLPYVSVSGTISSSTTRQVSFMRENSETVTYTHSSSVTVPPGHAILKKAIITRASLNVPWTGRVVNGLGAVKTIHGWWKGVDTYNLQVVQTDVMDM